MFYNCTNFNQTIGNWDVGNVENMTWMFYNCTNFYPQSIQPQNHYHFNPQDLSNWKTISVTSMYEMFWDATKFNQDLSSWTVNPDVTSCYYFGSEGPYTSGAYYWPETHWPEFNNCSLWH